MGVVIIIHFLSSGNIFLFALTDRIVSSTVSSGGRSCLFVRIIIESKNRLLYYLKCIAVQLFSRIITPDSDSVSFLLHFPPIISFWRRHSSLCFGILHILHCLSKTTHLHRHHTGHLTLHTYHQDPSYTQVHMVWIGSHAGNWRERE